MLIAGSYAGRERKMGAQRRSFLKIPNASSAAKLASPLNRTFGQEKCSLYLKFPSIGNVSPEFENQINKVIISFFLCCEASCGLQH